MNKQEILDCFLDFDPQTIYYNDGKAINCLILTEDRGKALKIIQDIEKERVRYYSNSREHDIRIDILPTTKEDHINTYRWVDVDYYKSARAYRFNYAFIDENISKEWFDKAFTWLYHCPKRNVTII